MIALTVHINKRKFINHLISAIFTMFMLINILVFSNTIAPNIGNALYIVLGIISLLICIFKQQHIGLKEYFLFTMFYSIFGLISWLYNANADLIELLWPLGFMSIGMLMINFNLSPKLQVISLYFFCAFAIFFIVQAGSSHLIDAQTSRNNISVYGLVYLCLYMFSCYKNKVSVSLVPISIYLIVCLIATGRGGIVTGSLLLVLNLIVSLKNGESRLKKMSTLMISLMFITLICLVGFYYLDTFIVSSITEFQMKGMETSRLSIWSDYYDIVFLSLPNILFGAKIEGSTVLIHFSQNLHNSFLMLHAKYGLMGFCLVLCLLLYNLKILFKEKNWYYIIPTVAVILRMSLDYTNFNGILDVVLINILLYSSKYRLNNYEQ